MAAPLRIGLLGFGNIGTGVIEALRDNGDLIAERCGRRLELRAIADLDITTARPVEVDRALLTTDANAVLRDPDIDLIIELIGGLEPARTFVEMALREGKHVVTANKALLAQHGPELAALARERNVRLLFEAAVGGGIPIVRVLSDLLVANRITRIEGVLNGTCNYILTQMLEEEISFEAALAEAQRLGYAEPDPTADVEGIDAANKIAILASLAFGRDIRFGDVWREGIVHLTLQDLKAAIAEGYVVKQHSVAEIDGEGRVSITVRPAFLWRRHPLASVHGVLNGVVIKGAPVGAIFLSGPGAGRAATASAILGDVMAAAVVRPGEPLAAPFLRVPIKQKPTAVMNEVCNGYYVRVLSDGSPDAIADVADTLTSNGAPIERIEESLWEQDDSGRTHAIEVFTGDATEDLIRRAAALIDEADWCAPDVSPLVLPRVD
jgi:homoserine dehydrogenase